MFDRTRAVVYTGLLTYYPALNLRRSWWQTDRISYVWDQNQTADHLVLQADHHWGYKIWLTFSLFNLSELEIQRHGSSQKCIYNGRWENTLTKNLFGQRSNWWNWFRSMNFDHCCGCMSRHHSSCQRVTERGKVAHQKRLVMEINKSDFVPPRQNSHHAWCKKWSAKFI